MKRKSQTLILSIGLFVSGWVQIGFWGFDCAPGPVGFVGALSTVLSALLGFVAFRDAVALERALNTIHRSANTAGETAIAASTEASKAVRAAEDAQRGRRLSPTQMEAIATSLAGVDLSGVRLSISFVAVATGAQDFAESIAQFLPRLCIHPDWPVARNPQAAPQPQPRINDTLFIVKSNPPGEVERLIQAFTTAVPEVHRSGEGSFGQVSARNQMLVVVGHRARQT